MLNERQFSLLDAIESKPVSLSVLARKTGVSARTILRDIDYLNFTLSGKAHIRAAGNALYQLDITDRKSYFQLLQRHDNDDRMLALLLIHPVISRAQLADALKLPDGWVAERLPRLKIRHQRAFNLASRPGAGHFVAVDEQKRFLLLANLFRKDPFVFPLPGINGATWDLHRTDIQAQQGTWERWTVRADTPVCRASTLRDTGCDSMASSRENWRSFNMLHP